MPERPKVYVALPHYGNCHPGAVSAWLQPGNATVDPVIVTRASTSATPHCFNICLAPALDARDRGEITHLAMIHSDVEVSPGWVDTLYDEMLCVHATAISAVIPIKEPERSRTSTAIGDLENLWFPKRYIRTGQEKDLPRTFTQKDVCRDSEVLLINTGCLLVDLRRDYWGDFAFEFRTRIVQRDGVRVAQFAPEDWLMSRTVQEHGDLVAATYAVQATHHGESYWRVG